jgi:hypothetical protein
MPAEQANGGRLRRCESIFFLSFVCLGRGLAVARRIRRGFWMWIRMVECEPAITE